MNYKVCVIALDGATMDLVEPWARAGKLKTLATFFEQGVTARLESVIPPITGPAWASFVTGKNPAAHGVGDWWYKRQNSYELLPVNSTRIRTATLWDLLAANDKRVGALNVPMTYPPPKTNGVVVSGLLTPTNRGAYTYPAEFRDELLKAIPDYRMNLETFYAPGQAEPFLNDLRDLIRVRSEAARLIYQRESPDFFMVHYIATDWVQHALWHLMDPTHPKHNPAEAAEYGDGILKIYQQIDAELEKLLALLAPNTTVIVMSDHGFGPLYDYIYLNTWLLHKGWLVLKSDAATRLKHLLFNLGLVPTNLYRLASRLGLSSAAVGARKETQYNLLKTFFLSAQNIDWARTRAYSVGNIGQIFLNVRGREAHGSVTPGPEYTQLRDQLIEQLQRELIHPRDGRSLADHIYRREEIYHGPFLEEMPDILVMPRNLEFQAAGLSEFLSNRVAEPSFIYSGGHRMDGTLLMRGGPVRAGTRLASARLVDLLPTILYLLDTPLLRDFDGQILQDALQEELMLTRPVRYAEGETKGQVSQEVYSEQESEEINERLRALGYLG
ncbi:MAG: alkaline phosphatase family protein [Anaerolineae bacterium]